MWKIKGGLHDEVIYICMAPTTSFRAQSACACDAQASSGRATTPDLWQAIRCVHFAPYGIRCSLTRVGMSASGSDIAVSDQAVCTFGV